MSAKLAFVFFSMILADNLVLAKLLGVCPVLNVSKDLRSSAGMGAAVTLVMVASMAVAWPLHHFILVPLAVTYLGNLLFVLLLVVFAQLAEMLLRKYLPPLYSVIGAYMPLVTTNCAVLGVTLLTLQTPSLVNPDAPYYTYPEALLCALGGGVGFLAAMLLFAGVRRRLVLAKPPQSFEGMPITLVAAGIVSLSVMGFGGLLEKLLGV